MISFGGTPNGVQLADLLAYNVYRAFRDENLEYKYVEMLVPHIYRRPPSHVLNGLKVWPDASPLAELARTVHGQNPGGETRYMWRALPGPKTSDYAALIRPTEPSWAENGCARCRTGVLAIRCGGPT